MAGMADIAAAGRKELAAGNFAVDKKIYSLDMEEIFFRLSMLDL